MKRKPRRGELAEFRGFLGGEKKRGWPTKGGRPAGRAAPGAPTAKKEAPLPLPAGH